MSSSLLLAGALVVAATTTSLAEGRRADCRALFPPPVGVVGFHGLRPLMQGAPVRAVLCEMDGRMIYRVTVLHRTGLVRTIEIDARSGAPLK